MVIASDLSFSYPGGQSFCYPALSVEPGGALLVLGKSGCGKTTLLHILGGLQRPASGSVLIQNKDITQMGEKELDRFRGQHIGIVFQKPHFVQSLTVEDNILLAPSLSRRKADGRRLHAVAAELGISHLMQRLPAKLSQGEQQRATIARAVIQDPSLLLADEPTSSLDDDNAIAVGRLLLRISQAHKAALIIVTHDERLKKLIPNHITLA